METTRRIYLLDDNDRDKEDLKTREEIKTLIDTYKNKEFPIEVSNRLTESIIALKYRSEITSLVGYNLLTENFLYNLSSLLYGNKCLEIMAGNGSLSKGLQDYNVDIIPTDNFSMINIFNNDLWTEVEKLDALEAIDKYGEHVDFVICSWIPYYKSIGYEAIKRLYKINPRAIFICIGEDKGGCTADDNFFDYSSEITFSEKMSIDYDLIEKIYHSLKNWYGINAKIKFLRYNGKDVRIFT